MKITSALFCTLLLSIFLASCSSSKPRGSVSIVPISYGVVNGRDLTFSMYITDKVGTKEEMIKKTDENGLFIHVGHILKIEAAKTENIAALKAIEESGFHIVNLSLEDIMVANLQEINLEQFKLKFLNTSVVDINEDDIFKAKNVSPFIVHEGAAILGLSDDKLSPKLEAEKFIVSDYVLAILKARKDLTAQNKRDKKNPAPPIRSFLIVHSLGKDILSIMERLPPNFMSSLAN